MVDLNLPAPGESPNWGSKLNTAIKSLEGVVNGMDPSGMIQEQYVGSNLSTPRIDWPGTVVWVTNASAGYPLHAKDGDFLWRVTESAEEVVISHNFSNKPDGPVGTTDVGDKNWTTTGTDGATGVAGVIASGALRLSGYGVGFGYVTMNTGIPNAITRMRVASVDTARSGQLFWRGSDSGNYLSIAMRTSASDPTARIASYTDGTATIVASLGLTIQAGDLLAMKSQGTFHEIQVNGVTRWSGNIAANTGGTRCGIRAAASSKDLTLTSYHTALTV